MATDWHLERFVAAQEPVYAQVCAELTAGRKRTHWMWFVFPQLKALGRSATAQFFGLDGADEAAAYWQHPLLGARLRQCAELVLRVPGTDAHAIFGSPDTLKLRSCMTLFEIVAPEAPVFGDVLVRYFGGMRDDATIAFIRA
ncbi:DUF1810 domain-containing protein [Variovorax sp. EBFNA2]|uniref:DUF1810 domain-containing protein n=1 Tax=Variovorax sp. EBFNA2 TaxID=3342097 RepID=UPI0029C0DCD7|nr:DUF1810 domain-containing protein [Variovorax boronicumulans]WPG38341.1 DUF1810 domain-containing protein [Variovorax boronicumulans]